MSQTREDDLEMLERFLKKDNCAPAQDWWAWDTGFHMIGPILRTIQIYYVHFS